MNLKCKTKIENFLTKNNLVDNYNILELLEEQNLENIIDKLESLPQDELTNFALECVCEGREIGRASVGKECRSRWSPYH